MKKLIAALLTGTLAFGALTGCGSSSTETPAQDGAAEEAAGDTAEESGDLQAITVAASATPHAEILEQAKPLLAEQGMICRLPYLTIMYSRIW